jgi:SAM-dependent methyltransferase
MPTTRPTVRTSSVLQFMRQHSEILRPGAVCLGWDSTEYAEMVTGCAPNSTWSLSYAPGEFVKVQVGKRRLLGNMDAMAGPLSVLGKAAASFDLVVCNQVFEHVSRPHTGARALFNLLRPGGYLFFAVPFNEQFHLIPGDFYRFTIDGARGPPPPHSNR